MIPTIARGRNYHGRVHRIAHYGNEPLMSRLTDNIPLLHHTYASVYFCQQRYTYERRGGQCAPVVVDGRRARTVRKKSRNDAASRASNVLVKVYM